MKRMASVGACQDALGAEETAAQVQSQALGVPPDGVGRASVDASTAAVGALRLIQHGQATEPIR